MNTTGVLQALQTSQLADNDLLHPDERAAVQQTLAELVQRGLLAYVVLLPESAELRDWYKLWPLLELREGSALLLLYNGRHWEARGWGLPADAMAQALQQAEAARSGGLQAGLTAALTALAARAAARTLSDHLPSAQEARTRRALATEGAAPLRLWLGGGSIILLGALAWLLFRRRRLQPQQFHTFTAAREAAEAAFTQVMVIDAALDSQIRDLQLQALTHKQHLDTLVVRVQQGRQPGDDPMLLGEIAHMVQQFMGLHTAILRRQKEKRSGSRRS